MAADKNTQFSQTGGVQARIEGDLLVVAVPLAGLRQSGSGKNRLVASTSGNRATALVVEGHPVTVGVNAYIPNK